MLCCLLLLFGAEDVVPLARAHAHNDYLHPRPLFDALSHGFCSVEADIILGEGNTLLVGHTRQELKPDRTLEKLYLEPLRQSSRAHGGTVYPQKKQPPFYLLIDIKTDAATTYPALHQVLTNYADILTEVRDGQVYPRAVTVVLSGSRPSLKTLAAQSPRYAGYDGRLSDLNSDVPAHLMPMISDNWALKLGWGGTKPMSAPERAKLKQIVQQAHSHHRLVRFWATPELESVWKVLQEENVDVINTDKLNELKHFLRSNGKE